MTPCLPKAFVSPWRTWWIRAVPGAFPERKMDTSSLFVSTGLSGTGSALQGRRNMRCAGAGSPFGMDSQRDDSWSQEKSLRFSLASSARLSLFPAGISKSFKAEGAAYLGCSSHLEYHRKCVSLICKINFCSLLNNSESLLCSKEIMLPHMFWGIWGSVQAEEVCPLDPLFYSCISWIKLSCSVWGKLGLVSLAIMQTIYKWERIWQFCYQYWGWGFAL